MSNTHIISKIIIICEGFRKQTKLKIDKYKRGDPLTNLTLFPKPTFLIIFLCLIRSHDESFSLWYNCTQDCWRRESEM